MAEAVIQGVDNLSIVDVIHDHMEVDVDDGIEKLNCDADDDMDMDSVSKLHKTDGYKYIMQKVEDGIVCKDDPEYHFILDCNALLDDIDNELLMIVNNFVIDKFPQLVSLVQNPIDYALLVKRIQIERNEIRVARHLEGGQLFLPPSSTMSCGIQQQQQLPEEELQKACDRLLALDSDKKKVVDFVESRMGFIAPNLSALVGTAVAAKLIRKAGCLSSLAKMQSRNVLLLGFEEEYGFETSQYPVGYLAQTEAFQTSPPYMKMRESRFLAANSTLAAHVDFTRGEKEGWKNLAAAAVPTAPKVRFLDMPPPPRPTRETETRAQLNERHKKTLERIAKLMEKRGKTEERIAKLKEAEERGKREEEKLRKDEDTGRAHANGGAAVGQIESIYSMF